MVGCGRARYCWTCRCDVYDVASLSTGDALAVLGAAGGPSHMRLYVRQDGSVMKTDCPVGVRRRRWRHALLAAITIGTLLPMSPSPPPLIWADPTDVDFARADHTGANLASVQGGVFRDVPRMREIAVACNDPGCRAEVTAKIALRAGVDRERLSRSTATLCFNQQCFSADMAALSEHNHVEFPARASSFWPVVTLGYEGPALRVYLYDRVESVHDGDVFDLTVRPRAGGPPLVRWHERVWYTVYQPKGK
jgi:hypothetical protein